MTNHELLNSLGGRIEFNFKICREVMHNAKWHEYGSKNCHDMWLVTSGEIRIEIDDKIHILKENDVFIFYPQVIYSASCINGECSFIYTHFDAALGGNLHALDMFRIGGHTESVLIAQEAALFVSSYEHYLNAVPMSILRLKSALILLISKIAEKRTVCAEAENSVNSNSQYIRLEKLLIYINKNLNKKITVKELAKFMCMSEKYFITHFRSIMGITPHNYITELKLKKSFDLLSQSKYSVKEIACILGYADSYTFSKAFKRFFGFSPSKIGLR